MHFRLKHSKQAREIGVNRITGRLLKQARTCEHPLATHAIAFVRKALSLQSRFLEAKRSRAASCMNNADKQATSHPVFSLSVISGLLNVDDQTNCAKTPDPLQHPPSRNLKKENHKYCVLCVCRGNFGSS